MIENYAERFETDAATCLWMFLVCKIHVLLTVTRSIGDLGNSHLVAKWPILVKLLSEIWEGAQNCQNFGLWVWESCFWAFRWSKPLGLTCTGVLANDSGIVKVFFRTYRQTWKTTDFPISVITPCQSAHCTKSRVLNIESLNSWNTQYMDLQPQGYKVFKPPTEPFSSLKVNVWVVYGTSHEGLYD